MVDETNAPEATGPHVDHGNDNDTKSANTCKYTVSSIPTSPLQAMCLSQPTSCEVNSLRARKVSARSQPTRAKSAQFGQSTMGTLEK